MYPIWNIKDPHTFYPWLITRFLLISNLISEDVHDQGEDGDQLEEDEAAAEHGQEVVQVEVV